MKSSEFSQNITASEITIAKLFNEIQKYDENSLVERILVFCEENELDPMEVGEELSKSKQFREVLWLDAVDNNQVKDLHVKREKSKTENLDEW